MASSSKKPASDDEKETGDHFRRTWDAKKFEEKAKNRLEEDLALLEENSFDKPKCEKIKKREKLKARDYAVDLSSKVGKTQLITKSTPFQDQGGYYCNVCDCVLRDSISFLDHINSRRHHRNMGMSMKMERSTLDQVKNRFALNKEKKEDNQKKKEYDFDAKINVLEEEEKRAKQRKRAAKAERKRKQEEALKEYQDDDVAALMGFGGFGGSKVNIK